MQRVGDVLRYGSKRGDIPAHQEGGGLRQEPHPENKAHQVLRHESGDHRQSQGTNQQFTQALEQIYQHDKPRRRQPLRIRKPHPGSCGRQEAQRAQEHTERKFHRHSQVFAFVSQTGIDRGQYRTCQHHPERVQRLEAHWVNGETENFMVHVIDSKEVQRCRHLRVQHVEHNRFQHQDEGHEHLVAPGFIQFECLTEEDDSHGNRQDDQHQVGNLHVVHQPGADKYHHYRTGQHVQQITEIQRLMVWLRTDIFYHSTAGKVDQQRDDKPGPAQVVGHRVAKLIGNHRRQRQRQQ